MELEEANDVVVMATSLNNPKVVVILITINIVLNLSFNINIKIIFNKNFQKKKFTIYLCLVYINTNI